MLIDVAVPLFLFSCFCPSLTQHYEGQTSCCFTCLAKPFVSFRSLWVQTVCCKRHALPCFRLQRGAQRHLARHKGPAQSAIIVKHPPNRTCRAVKCSYLHLHVEFGLVVAWHATCTTWEWRELCCLSSECGHMSSVCQSQEGLANLSHSASKTFVRTQRLGRWIEYHGVDKGAIAGVRV